MPARNSIKQYQEGGFYHVYNRGVEKRVVFLDDQDYRVFVDRLRRYLDPSYQTSNNNRSRHTSLSGKVDLLAFCLMPNHFHLLLRQNTQSGMEELMRRVMTSYSMYFNLKYGRVGSLFQGRYRAVLVAGDEYLTHLSRYIHLNPCDLRDYHLQTFSSLPYYLGTPAPLWLNPEPILQQFSASSSYAQFMDDLRLDSVGLLGNLAIDA